MPVFTLASTPSSVGPGEQASLVSAADGAGTLGAGNYSVPVALQDKDNGVKAPVTVTFTYAAAPAAVQYDIYGAWDMSAPPSTWTKIGTTNNVNGDQVTFQRAAAGGPNFRFICVEETTSPGVITSVKVNM